MCFSIQCIQTNSFEVVTFLLVSWVRCGAWLFRFLISAIFRAFIPFVYAYQRHCGISSQEVSADNRLSLAKSLVTTGCHQQKVCWQPAVFSNTTVYLAVYMNLVAF